MVYKSKYFIFLNKILYLVVGLIFLYFCSKLIIGFEPSSIVDGNKKGHLKDRVKTFSLGEKENKYGHYAEGLKKRNIFEFTRDKAIKAAKAVTAPVRITQKKSSVPSLVLKFIKSLKLVGIILDDNSEAIVVDSKKNETLFLNKGDVVQGAVVESIIEGKVIFLFEGKRIELIQ